MKAFNFGLLDVHGFNGWQSDPELVGSKFDRPCDGVHLLPDAVLRVHYCL